MVRTDARSEKMDDGAMDFRCEAVIFSLEDTKNLEIQNSRKLNTPYKIQISICTMGNYTHRLDLVWAISFWRAAVYLF